MAAQAMRATAPAVAKKAIQGQGVERIQFHIASVSDQRP
jgi:hypothetical protein